MNQSYCCVTWRELAPELIQNKTNEVESLMKDKGLPRSVFASVIKVLNTMTNYCPTCGQCLNQDLLHVRPTPIEVHPVDNHSPVAPPAKGRTVCPQCKGKGILSRDSQGIEIKCTVCHGERYYDREKHAKFIPIEKGNASAQSDE